MSGLDDTREIYNEIKKHRWLPIPYPYYAALNSATTTDSPVVTAAPMDTPKDEPEQETNIPQTDKVEPQPPARCSVV